jgi:DNA-binding transcriptional LysR family regulator
MRCVGWRHLAGQPADSRRAGLRWSGREVAVAREHAMTDSDPTARMPLPEEPPADEPAGQPATGMPAGSVGFPMPPSTATSDGWSQPPPRRSRTGSGRVVTLVLGLILLGAGLWYLAEVTFGIDLPTVTWSQFWPVILIAIGAWVVLGSMRNARR